MYRGTIYKRYKMGMPVSQVLKPRKRNKKRYLTLEGIRRPLAEWAKLKGIEYMTLYARLIGGRPLLAKPRQSVQATFKDRTQSLTEWSRELGIYYSLLYQRWKNGRPLTT